MADLSKPVRMTAAERQALRRRPLGYRQPVRRTNASNAPDLALAKGPTRHEEQSADRDHENAVKRSVRAQVWRRAAYCEVCGDSERDTALKYPKATHEAHEEPPRSATRGRPPEERFHVDRTLRACCGCHEAMTRNTVRPVPKTARGFSGPYDIERKNHKTGEWEVIRQWRQP